MRVWEAIEMLKGMDGNKEVTVTLGVNRKVKEDEYFPWPKTYPLEPQPTWVVRDYRTGINTVTCKAH